MSCRYWREAATLIIIGRAGMRCGKKHTENIKSWATNYNLLLLKRSAKSSFMPAVYVFPGGTIDEADFSLQWLDLFRAHGYITKELYKMFKFETGRPFLYTNKSSSQLLPELAMRICALRETFEETGLLFSNTAGNEHSGSVAVDNFLTLEERENWRLKIHKDAYQFHNLFHHIGKLPDIWNLYEWTSWLTPTHYERRYDTAFYISFLDSEIPALLNSSEEAEVLQVEKPFEILKAHHERKAALGPPQLVEIGRLLNFSDLQNLKTFSEKRRFQGMLRWLPVRVAATNGVVVVLPGDDLYPRDPDYFGTSSEKDLSISDSVEDSRKLCVNLNRCEFPKSEPSRYITNIPSEYGHLAPPVIKFT